MKKIISLCYLLFVLTTLSTAQKLGLEKTYEITGKARRGYLDDVAYDAVTKNTMLSFVTKESTSITGSKSKVKYQNYFFDEQFNFIKMDEKVDEYRNKKYKGDKYSVEGVSMENNLLGTFVLRRKMTTYTWDWFFGGYNKKIKLLEKVKPKDDAGKKYTLIKKFENDVTGEIIAMVRAKGKDTNPNEFVFLKINKDLDFEVTDKATFDNPQVVAYAGLISSLGQDEDEGNLDEEDSGDDSPDASDDQGDLSTTDAAFIFAPSMAGKKGNSDEHDYTYWRINGQGKILKKVGIKTLASVWNINQIIDAGESLYLFGPANEGKYYDQTIKGAFLGVSADLEGMKWKLFQMCKITNSKVDYVTSTDLEEFESKLMAPPSQKKSPSYKGKKFHFTTADLYKDGSILICGQNYQMVTRNKVKVKSYRDVMMFNFDPTGKLKAQYGVRREENNKYAQMAPTGQTITAGANSIYWTVMEMDGIRTEREGKFKTVKALIYPSVARIDAATGSIGDFVQFGTVNDKPTYYLHNRIPMLPISTDNAIVYLGTNKSGKTLWFGKVILE